MDYIVLNEEDVDVLRKRIIEKSKMGFKLAGGVQVVLMPGARFLQFFQAMYKDDESN